MQKWLESLKTAIIEEDADALDALLDVGSLKNMRAFATRLKSATPQDLAQALALMDEARKLVEREQQKLAPLIKKMQRAKQFLSE